MDWKDVTIDLRSFDVAELLQPWAWLVGARVRPWGLNLFGDWFLEDERGQLIFLDAMAGELETVCPASEFNARLADVAFRTELLRLDLLATLREQGVQRSPVETYAYKHPPVLGGSTTAENIIVLGVRVWQYIAGQLHEQLRFGSR